jgi:hypothetical protein
MGYQCWGDTVVSLYIELIRLDASSSCQLEVAEGFLAAYRLCDPEGHILHRPNMMALPAIVCAAFSTEVGLKCIARSCGVVIRGHDLRDIYDKLPQHFRSQIQEGTCRSEVEFDKQLEKARHAFVQWRYVYESESFLLVNVGFLGQLSAVVCSISSKLENAT